MTVSSDPSKLKQSINNLRAKKKYLMQKGEDITAVEREIDTLKLRVLAIDEFEKQKQSLRQQRYNCKRRGQDTTVADRVWQTFKDTKEAFLENFVANAMSQRTASKTLDDPSGTLACDAGITTNDLPSGTRRVHFEPTTPKAAPELLDFHTRSVKKITSKRKYLGRELTPAEVRQTHCELVYDDFREQLLASQSVIDDEDVQFSQLQKQSAEARARAAEVAAKVLSQQEQGRQLELQYLHERAIRKQNERQESVKNLLLLGQTFLAGIPENSEGKSLLPHFDSSSTTSPTRDDDNDDDDNEDNDMKAATRNPSAPPSCNRDIKPAASTKQLTSFSLNGNDESAASTKRPASHTREGDLKLDFSISCSASLCRNSDDKPSDSRKPWASPVRDDNLKPAASMKSSTFGKRPISANTCKKTDKKSKAAPTKTATSKSNHTASLIVTWGNPSDGQRGVVVDEFIPPSVTILPDYKCRVTRIGTSSSGTFLFGHGSLFSCGGEVIGRELASEKAESLANHFLRAQTTDEKIRKLLEGGKQAGLLNTYLNTKGYIDVPLGDGSSELSKAKAFKQIIGEMIRTGDIKEDDVLHDNDMATLNVLIEEAEKIESLLSLQEGERDEFRSRMKLVHFFDGSKDHTNSIIDFACGDDFAVALSQDGTLYFFGRFREEYEGAEFSFASADHGTIFVQQGKHHDGLQTLKPLAIPLPLNGTEKPIKVTAGPQFYHVYLDNGKVLSAGLGEYGQLGRSGTTTNLKKENGAFDMDSVRKSLFPGLCEFTLDSGRGLRGWKIKKIAGGVAHALVLWEKIAARKRETRLYAIGTNRQGQMGLGEGVAGSIDTLLPISFFEKLEILDIACGEKHSCVLVKGGILYCFGSNASGQLGVPLDATKAMSSSKQSIQYHSSVPIRPFASLSKVIEKIAAGKTTTHAISNSPTLYGFGAGEAATGDEMHSPSRGIIALDLNKSVGLGGYRIRGFNDLSVCIDHGGVVVEVAKANPEETSESAVRKVLAFSTKESCSIKEPARSTKGNKKPQTNVDPQAHTMTDTATNGHGFVFEPAGNKEQTHSDSNPSAPRFFFNANPKSDARANSAIDTAPSIGHGFFSGASASKAHAASTSGIVSGQGFVFKPTSNIKIDAHSPGILPTTQVTGWGNWPQSCASGWKCEICLTRNGLDLVECVSCTVPKGQWSCDMCMFDKNKPATTECVQCKAPKGAKPKRGIDASEHKGLDKTSDQGFKA